MFDTVALLAPGASLTEEAAQSARGPGVLTVAITDAFRRAPWADALYAYDSKWWDNTPDAWAFAGAKLSSQPTLRDTQEIGGYAERIEVPHPTEPGKKAMFTTCSSGLSAIRIAEALGFKRILLYGFDRRPGHFHNRHSNEGRPGPEIRTFAAWGMAIDRMIREFADDGIELRRVVTFDDGVMPERFDECKGGIYAGDQIIFASEPTP